MSVVAHDPTTGEVLSGEVIEELDAEAARALTDRINHSTVLAAQLVAEAWQGRAWKSLGYRSWEDYADAELPLLGSNSANRQVLLVGLRKVGMSTRAIAAATGLHHSTVARGVANATPDEITGTDGKQYDPSHPSRIRRSETVEFAGEAGTGDSPAMSSGGPSPTFDPGEAATGDGAEREPSTVHPSPGSPPAPPPEDERDAAVARLKRSIAKAHDLLTWKPEDIHALNDPDCAVRVTELMRQMAPWWETYKTTKPTGLVVHKGGKA